MFCMLNMAYSGLVLFGKFLYLSFCSLCILVLLPKFCNNVIIFAPSVREQFQLFFFALSSLSTLPFTLTILIKWFASFLTAS